MRNTLETTRAARRRPDELERGPDRVRGGVRRAGDHPVGQALVDHHRAEVRRVAHLVERLVRGDALVPAQRVVGLGEVLAVRRGQRVHDPHARQGQPERRGAGPDVALGPEHGQVDHAAAAGAGRPPIRIRSSLPSGSTMWRRSARARSISACSNISGVVRVGRAWVIRSTRAEVSTPSSNSRDGRRDLARAARRDGAADRGDGGRDGVGVVAGGDHRDAAWP